MIKLGDILNEIIEGLQEAKYQGRTVTLNKPLIYFQALVKYVEAVRQRLPQDSYVQNQIDEIVDLLETTKYKLENLR